MAIKIAGVQLGNLTGGPSSLSLEDLSDVSAATRADGQFLRYNSGVSEWQNAYIDADIYSFLNTNFTSTNGITLTKTAGPNTIVASLTNTGVANATYGDATHYPIISVDLTGRITSASSALLPTSMSNILGGSAGALVYQFSSGTTAFLSAGTTDQVLISGASAPSWANISALTVGASTNIAGGVAGQVAYQSDVSTTAFVTNGPGVLYAATAGAVPAWSTAPTLTGTNITGIPNAGLTNSSITIGSTAVALGATQTSFTGLTSLGSSAATALSITTGTTGALTLDSGTTGAVNIGTNANAKTVTIGNISGASSVVVNTGTAGTMFSKGAVFSPVSGAHVEVAATSNATSWSAQDFATANGVGLTVRNTSQTNSSYSSLSLLATNTAGTVQGVNITAQSTSSGQTPTLVISARTAAGVTTDRLTIDTSGIVNLNNDLQLNNAQYVRGKIAAGTSTRMLGINSGDAMFVGSVDATIGSMQFSNNGTSMAILTTGGLAIGSVAPATGSKLDIQSGSQSILMGADSGLTTRTNATLKAARIAMPHYLTASADFLLMTGVADVSANTIDFGGNSGTKNSATQIRFYAAANNTTVTGTLALTINSTAATVSLGTASTTSSTGALVVTGGVGVGGAITGASTITGTALIPTGSAIPLNGLYLPATNSVALSTASTNRLQIDAAGNIGVNGAPSVWGTGGSARALEFAAGALLSFSTTEWHDVHNAFWNGTNWTYKTTGFASEIKQSQAGVQFNYAASGTAASTFAFSEAMYIGTSGLVSVGGTHGASPLNVYSLAAGTGITGTIHVNDVSAASSVSPNGIYLTRTATPSATGTASPSIFFDVGSGGGRASIYTVREGGAGGNMILATQTTGAVMTERVFINSLGNVGIGTGIAAPASRLQVASNANSSTAITISNTDVGASADARLSLNNGTNIGAAIILRGSGNSSEPNELLISSGSASYPINFYTGSSRGKVLGTGQLVFGSTNATAQTGLVTGSSITPTIQTMSGTADGFMATRYSVTDAAMNGLILAKVASATVGDFTTAVAVGEALGYVSWSGSDTAKLAEAARITVEVDTGTPGLNSIPGRMIFSTSPDGSATPAERLRLNAAGAQVTGSLLRASQLDYYSTYNCVPATFVAITVQPFTTGATTTLVNGNVYRIHLTTQGTGISTGTTYIAYQTAAGVWALWNSTNTGVAAGDNKPQLRVTGTTLEVFTNHATISYTVGARVEVWTTGNTTISDPGVFGVDGAVTTSNKTLILGGVNTQPLASELLQVSTAAAGAANAVAVLHNTGTTLNTGTALNFTALSNSGALVTLASVTGIATSTTGDGALIFKATAAGSNSEIMRVASTGATITGTATAGGFIPTSSTIVSSGLYLPAADTLALSTGTTERIRINSAGNIGIGTTTPASAVQIGGDSTYRELRLRRSSDAAPSAQALVFYKTRGTEGAPTATVSGDTIGTIFWSATDASATPTIFNAAKIEAFVDNTVAATSVPSRLVFSTTSLAGTAAVIRATLDSAGNFILGNGSSSTTPSSAAILGTNASTASTDLAGASITVAAGRGTGAGTGGSLLFQTAPAGTTGTTLNALRTGIALDSNGMTTIGGTTVAAATPRVIEVVGTVSSGTTNIFNIETDRSLQYSGMTIVRNDNTNSSPNFGIGATINIARTAGSTVGSNALVAQDMPIGGIAFAAADGTDIRSRAAEIYAVIDGIAAANNTPGRLIFATTPSGAAASVERIRIDNVGNVTTTLQAAGQFKVASAVAPTTSMVQITNAGFPAITANSMGLQIVYRGGAVGGIETAAARIDITPGTTSTGIWDALRILPTNAAPSGVRMNGIKFDAVTPDAGNDNMIFAGTGWDTILNYNGVTVIDGTGQVVGSQVTGAVSTATNVAGGAAGSLVYQTNAGATSTLAIGSAGTFLRSSGTAPAWSTSTIADTFAINSIPYASAANTLTALAPANSLVMTSSATGVPTWSTISMITAAPDYSFKDTVRLATTADLGASTFSANVLTGYPQTTAAISATSTAASTTLTLTSTATVSAGAQISVASTFVPAGLTVSIVSTSTTVLLNTATRSSATTGASGTGTTATITFSALTFAPYAVGASITVAGVTPAGYNGTFTVTACTTTSVSYANATTGAQTVAGTVSQTISAGTANLTFTNTIAALTIDGTAAVLGDRVLVKDQSTLGGIFTATAAANNGIYTVTAIGSTSVPWTLTRAADADLITEIDAVTVGVGAGTANGGRKFQSAVRITDTLNTTPMYWGRIADVNASALVGTPTSAAGIDIAVGNSTLQLVGGNVTDLAFNSMAATTVSATSASTYTRGSTLYIAGAPIAGTNATITTPYALYVAAGNTSLGGTLSVSGAISGSVFVGSSSTGNLIGTAAAYAGQAAALSLTYAGATSGFGLVLKPNSVASTTNAFVFLSSTSTTATPVVLAKIEHLASDAGMNLTGTWTLNGTALATTSSTVSTATNVAGGAAGSLVYQTNTGTTSALAIGTGGKFLRSTGTLPAWSTATIADTFAINSIPYASAADTLTALAPANSLVMTSSATGVPTWSTLNMVTAAPDYSFKDTVRLATTADLGASTFSANVLTGYSTTSTTNTTTTAASTTLTVVSSAGIKVGAVVSTATVQLAAGTTVATIASATSITVTNRANITTTAITGTGTTATATFAAQTFAPYAVGSTIVVSGTTPATYSGTFVVTACTTTSVSWASAETVTATVQGTIAFTIAAGTAVSTTFTNTIAALTIDGTAAVLGDRVLVKDQSTVGGIFTATAAANNGIYTVTAIGSASVPWTLTRSADADAITDLDAVTVGVSVGTANGGRKFQSAVRSTDTLNTTPMYWGRIADVNASALIGTPTTAVGIDIAVGNSAVQLVGGSVTDLAFNSMAATTVTATTASTYTRAATLYIAGAPAASTNATITTPYALYVAAGNTNLGGTLLATGAITSNSTVSGSALVPTSATVPTNGIFLPAANTIGISTNGNGTAGFRQDSSGQVGIGITPAARIHAAVAVTNSSTALRLGNTTDTSYGQLQFVGSTFATATRQNNTELVTNGATSDFTVLINGTEQTRTSSTGFVVTGATSGIGYGTGSGGAVTQITSRTTGVTLNKTNGAITLVSAAGTTAWQSFTVTNSTVAATDVIHVAQRTGTDLYQIFVTAVAAGSFRISFATTGGTTTETPIFNFAVIKAVAA